MIYKKKKHRSRCYLHDALAPTHRSVPIASCFDVDTLNQNYTGITRG